MAMKTIKISFIMRKDKVWQKGKNKDGKFVSVSLKTEKAPDLWINGIGDALNAKWKKGDEVTVDIESKKMDDGRVFYNFKNPTAKDSLADVIQRIEELEQAVERLENIVKAGKIIGNGEEVHRAVDDGEGNLPL